MDKKEIRDILLRRIVQLDEGFWGAAAADAKFHFHGVRDGAGDVRLFGVTHLIRNYQIAEMKPADALKEVEAVLYSMGRPIQMKSAPEGKTCLFTPGWIAPVLLTCRKEGSGLQMAAYTGRSLITGKARCRIALWLLRQRLPAGILHAGEIQKADRSKEEKKKEPAPKAEKKTTLKKKKKYTPKRLKK